MILLRELNGKYSEELAKILSTDEKLHNELSPNSKMVKVTGIEYMQRCSQWETQKKGKCYAIVEDEYAIGGIAFSHKGENMASIGYWVKSEVWGNGICSEAFGDILLKVKDQGYSRVMASILKNNIASKRIWEKYNATLTEDEERWYPVIEII